MAAFSIHGGPMSKKIPVAVPQGAKWCHGCQQVKPVQMFGIDRSKNDGRRYCCLRCGDRKALERAERGRMMNEVFLRVGLR
jgi:hypothetical protein